MHPSGVDVVDRGVSYIHIFDGQPAAQLRVSSVPGLWLSRLLGLFFSFRFALFSLVDQLSSRLAFVSLV